LKFVVLAGGIMTGSGGHAHMRASHADRDAAVVTLKAAFIQGRITRDEFDLRLGEALVARTYRDLAVLTADLPAGIAGHPLPAAPAAPGVPAASPASAAGKAAVAAGVALVLVGLAAFLGVGADAGRWVLVALFFLPSGALSTIGLVALHSWLEKREQLPLSA
jgi:hypothetical protein